MCRPPTVETVHRLTLRFGNELTAAAASVYQFGKSPGNDPIATFLPWFIMDGERLAFVLSSCVDLHGGAPGEFEEMIAAETQRQLRADLARAVLSLVVDLPRVVKSLELEDAVAGMDAPAAAPPDTELEGPNNYLLALAIVAQCFSVGNPADIMAWGYEAFLEISEEIVPHLLPKPPEGTPGAGAQGDPDDRSPTAMIAQLAGGSVVQV